MDKDLIEKVLLTVIFTMYSYYRYTFLILYLGIDTILRNGMLFKDC